MNCMFNIGVTFVKAFFIAIYKLINQLFIRLLSNYICLLVHIYIFGAYLLYRSTHKPIVNRITHLYFIQIQIYICFCEFLYLLLYRITKAMYFGERRHL
jgi:hypothetical protein